MDQDRVETSRIDHVMHPGDTACSSAPTLRVRRGPVGWRLLLRCHLLIALGFVILPMVKAASAGVSESIAQPGGKTLRPLTTMKEVRELAPEDARLGHPVKLRATVTGFRSNIEGYFVADETGPGYISRDSADREERPDLEIGQILEIEGVSHPGTYAPQVREQKRTPVGRGVLPLPRHLTFEQMVAGGEDCQYAEIEGVVRSVAGNGIVLAMGAGRVDVGCSALDPRALDGLVDARVKLRGVVCGVFNRRRQWVGVRFNVSSPDSIVVLTPAPPDPFSGPVHSIGDLLRWELNLIGMHRVKVSGVVTHFQPGSALFIREGSTGLLVRTAETQPLVPGDTVEVLGFPAFGTYSAILEDAVFRNVGHAAAPAAQAVAPERLLGGEWDMSLVSVRGTLLESVRQQGARVLVMQAGDIIFHARLGLEKQETELPAAGSELEVTGICIVAETTVNGARLSPRMFSILLRSPQDIRTLEAPSWWTAHRLWQAIGVISVAALGILTWVWLLQRQVQAQTAVLKDQTQREAVLEERTRIAQELHDTLDQELTGITLQLNAAVSMLQDDSVGQRLDVIQRLLQRSQSEVRRSVWDLRRPALESGGVAAALEAVASQLRHGSTAALDIKVQGEMRPLPALVEHHLLRIASEAMTNAFRHSAATRVVVELLYEPCAVGVRVTDDGRGFVADEAPGHEVGHFGLIGMRERTRKIGGVFTINSQPGNGTRVEIWVEEGRRNSRAPVPPPPALAARI